MIASAILLVAAALAKDIPPAGHATASGIVEIPLYTAPAGGDFGWYIEAKINDKPVLLQISTATVGMELTEAAAGRLGLKPTGKEGEKTASVKQIDLGGVSITGVKAAVGMRASNGVEGKIGVTSFPELAWAILPSAGKVKLGPAGPSSVASELGADIPYTSRAKADQKLGKAKLPIAAAPILVDATVSGVKLQSCLASGSRSSSVLDEVDTGLSWYSVRDHQYQATPLPAFDGLQRADVELEWREVGLAGVAQWVRVDRTGGGLGSVFRQPACIGFDALEHFDIGVDPSRAAVTLRANSGSAASSYRDAYLARVEESLKPPAEPPADAGAARTAAIGPTSAAASAYLSVAQYEKAVEYAKKWTELEPERCSSWHALGGAMLATGNAAGALPHLRKAADLYTPWAARPLQERKELAESEEKRVKRPDFDGVYSQPHSCHTASGDVAGALLATGSGPSVAELYPSRLDLDSGLPRAAGTAALVAGNAASAEAAFRQAVKLSYQRDTEARVGMMLATRSRDADLALSQFVSDPDGPLQVVRYLTVYAETLRQARGADGAIAALEAYLSRVPYSEAAWLALASEQAAAGRDATASVARAQALLDRQIPWDGDNARLHALQAEAHRLAGKLDAAAASAEKALSLDAGHADAYFVRARVAEAQGDAAKAAEWRKKAGMVAAANPLYGSLLGG